MDKRRLTCGTTTNCPQILIIEHLVHEIYIWILIDFGNLQIQIANGAQAAQLVRFQLCLQLEKCGIFHQIKGTTIIAPDMRLRQSCILDHKVHLDNGQLVFGF